MTREEAIKILDPKTSRNALLKYKEGEQRLEACNEACRIAASAPSRPRWTGAGGRGANGATNTDLSLRRLMVGVTVTVAVSHSQRKPGRRLRGG